MKSLFILFDVRWDSVWATWFCEFAAACNSNGSRGKLAITTWLMTVHRMPTSIASAKARSSNLIFSMLSRPPHVSRSSSWWTLYKNIRITMLLWLPLTDPYLSIPMASAGGSLPPASRASLLLKFKQELSPGATSTATLFVKSLEKPSS